MSKKSKRSSSKSKQEDWIPVERQHQNKSFLSAKKIDQQEAYLITLPPGVKLEDLNGQVIRLPSILKNTSKLKSSNSSSSSDSDSDSNPGMSRKIKQETKKSKSKPLPREILCQDQSSSVHEFYQYENPMTDTKLESNKRVKKLGNKLLYKSNVLSHTQLGSSMVVLKSNQENYTEPKKIMQPIDGEIIVSNDLLGEMGELTPSDLTFGNRLLEDHKAPIFDEDDRKKRWFIKGDY